MVYFANFGARRTWRDILGVHNMHDTKKKRELEYFNTDQLSDPVFLFSCPAVHTNNVIVNVGR